MATGKIIISNKKFIRNIIIAILALFIVAFIVNIAPGYKRNKYRNVTNIVIGEENVTEKLQKPIYKNEKEVVYISKEDVQELLDKTIYYDESEKRLITTSEVAVASIIIGEKKMAINGATIDILNPVIYENDTIYIPINEIEIIYNIEVKYLKDEDIIIIDKLNEGMIKAEADEKTIIRYKARKLSKKVGIIEEGEIVSAFYTTSKGWRLIRTEEGIIGYVKANTLTNEYIVRQDMNQEIETKTITVNIEDNTLLNIDGDEILIKDLLILSNEGISIKNSKFINDNQEAKIWSNLNIGNTDLENYDNRAKIIKSIISISMKNDVKGINIISTRSDIYLERFIIELAPRLKEIGIKINVAIEDKTNTESYIDIVNYLIKKEI